MNSILPHRRRTADTPVPLHRITGTDDPPSRERGSDAIPAWLWNLPLDYPTTAVVLSGLAAAWWQGLRWGVAVGASAVALAWWLT